MQQQLRKHRNEEESIRKKRVFSRYKNIFLEILKIFRDWKFLIIKETWKILCIFILLCRAGKKHRRALWLLFFFCLIFLCARKKFQNFSYPCILYEGWRKWDDTKWRGMCRWFLFYFLLHYRWLGASDSGKVGNQFVVVFFSSVGKLDWKFY